MNLVQDSWTVFHWLVAFAIIFATVIGVIMVYPNKPNKRLASNVDSKSYTHPNAILLLELIPDIDFKEGLASDTLIAILKRYKNTDQDEELSYYIMLGSNRYYVCASNNESAFTYKVYGSQETESILMFNMITYGDGELMSWDDLVVQQKILDDWAKVVSAEFHCTYKISITANNW